MYRDIMIYCTVEFKVMVTLTNHLRHINKSPFFVSIQAFYDVYSPGMDIRKGDLLVLNLYIFLCFG